MTFSIWKYLLKKCFENVSIIESMHVLGMQCEINTSLSCSVDVINLEEKKRLHQLNEYSYSNIDFYNFFSS